MRLFSARGLTRAAAATALAFGALSCGGGTEDAATSSLPPAPEACAAPASWFPHDQTPEPSNMGAFNTNCEFQQWSWQSLLWLTQPVPGGRLRFETFASPAALIPPDGGTLPPYASRTISTTLALMPRSTKSQDPTTLGEINQAGSLGLLIDREGRAVYYAQYLNETFYEFVRENGLYDPQKLAAASPTLEFPIGSLELKAAWKIVEAGEDTSGFYTRAATINPLAARDGTVVVDPTQTENVTVALVGLHIAGVVENHPEFIWATFEQQRNAPTLSDEMLNELLTLNSDASIRAFNAKPVSDMNFTFYQANTPAGQSNVNNAGDVRLADPAAQTLTPVTNVYIEYAQGGGDDTGGSANRANIRSINASVLAQLQDPIWSRYYLGGATWLNAPNALVPNSTQQDVITGSKMLSNSTMETFTQKVLSQNNCFQCHNTLQRFAEDPKVEVTPLGGKNVNVSHIIVNMYFQQSERQQRTAAGAR